MRIAYFLSTFPVLSETFISREILNLLHLGVDIEIVAFSRPEAGVLAKCSNDIQQLAEKTHYVSHMEALTHGLSGLGRMPILDLNRRIQRQTTRKSPYFLRLGRAYEAAARIQRSGVTHIHAHWPYSSLIAFLVSKMTNIPFSVSIHAHEPTCENGHFPLILRDASFAVFCNHSQMRLLQAQLPEAFHSKFHLVYHGVDLTAFSPSPIPSMPLKILSAGRLCQDKRFDRLIRACASAVHEGIDLELTILGSGELEHELRQLAEKLGFSNRLKMPGWVAHEEVRSYMIRSHMFALLSTDYGLPNVVLEAMACGRPVVLSTIPEAAKAVVNGQDGFIVQEPDNPLCLVEILKILSEKPEQIAQMGNAARGRAIQEFDEQIYIKKLAELFQSRDA